MTIIFKVIDMTIGLRVSEEEEIVGLDSKEHGLASAYAGFSIMDITEGAMNENENTDLGVADYDSASSIQRAAAVPVAGPVDADTGMHKVVIIAKLSKYDRLKSALNNLGVTGMTVTQVMGCGIQKGAGEKYRGVEMDVTVLPKVKVEVIVGNIPVEKVIETASKTLYTGHVGDGKIFVYNVQKVVKVRTGEEDLEKADLGQFKDENEISGWAKEYVAEALHIEVDQVNIKATTEEGLGFTGTGEGISSQAIANLDTIANYSYRVGSSEGGCAGCGGCMKVQES